MYMTLSIPLPVPKIVFKVLPSLAAPPALPVPNNLTNIPALLCSSLVPTLGLLVVVELSSVVGCHVTLALASVFFTVLNSVTSNSSAISAIKSNNLSSAMCTALRFTIALRILKK